MNKRKKRFAGILAVLFITAILLPQYGAAAAPPDLQNYQTIKETETEAAEGGKNIQTLAKFRSDNTEDGNGKTAKPLLKQDHLYVSRQDPSAVPSNTYALSGLKNFRIEFLKEKVLLISWTSEAEGSTEFYYGKAENPENSVIYNTPANRHQVFLKYSDPKELVYFNARTRFPDGKSVETGVLKFEKFVYIPVRWNSTDKASGDTADGTGPKNVLPNFKNGSLEVRDPSALSYVFEQEPNDTFASAQPVPVGTVFGSMAFSADNDWYKVSLAAGQKILVQLKGVAEENDFDIELYNADMLLKGSSCWPENYDEAFSFLPESAGVYYIKITAYSCNPVVEGSYQLILGADSLSAPAVTGHSMADAAVLAANTPYQASLSGPDDEDWLVFDAERGGKLVVKLTGPEKADYELQAYDIYGTPLGGSYAGLGQDEYLSYLVSFPGKYYIRIYSLIFPKAESPDSRGSAAGLSAAPDRTYEVTALLADPDIYEANESMAFAAPLTAATVIKGTIDNPWDEDWYRLHVPEAARVHVKLQDIPADTDYDLFLYFKSGQVAGGHALEGGTAEEISVFLDPGDYYIRVTAYRGFSCQSFYTLAAAFDHGMDSLSASYDALTGKVNIVGKTGAGAGNQVSLCVVGPDGTIQLADQIPAKNEGNFTYTFRMTGQAEGTYRVVAGGEGILSPLTATFAYRSSDTPGSPEKNGQSAGAPKLQIPDSFASGPVDASAYAFSPEGSASVTAYAFKNGDTGSLIGNLSELKQGDTLNLEVTVRNEHAGPMDTIVLTALYGPEGEMQKLECSPLHLDSGASDKTAAEFTLPPENSGYRVKVFLWNGNSPAATHLLPLSVAHTLGDSAQDGGTGFDSSGTLELRQAYIQAFQKAYGEKYMKVVPDQDGMYQVRVSGNTNLYAKIFDENRVLVTRNIIEKYPVPEVFTATTYMSAGKTYYISAASTNQAAKAYTVQVQKVGEIRLNSVREGFARSHIQPRGVDIFEIDADITPDTLVTLSLSDFSEPEGSFDYLVLRNRNTGKTVSSEPGDAVEGGHFGKSRIRYFRTSDTENTRYCVMVVSPTTGGYNGWYSINVKLVNRMSFVPEDTEGQTLQEPGQPETLSSLPENTARTYCISSNPEHLSEVPLDVKSYNAKARPSELGENGYYLQRSPVNGNANIFWEHINEYNRNMRFGVLLWNTDSKPLTVKLNARSFYGTDTYRKNFNFLTRVWTERAMGSKNTEVDEKDRYYEGFEPDMTLTLPAYMPTSPHSSAKWICLYTIGGKNGPFFFNGVAGISITDEDGKEYTGQKLFCDTYLMDVQNRGVLPNHEIARMKAPAAQRAFGDLTYRGSGTAAVLESIQPGTTVISEQQPFSFLIGGYDVPLLNRNETNPIIDYVWDPARRSPLDGVNYLEDYPKDGGWSISAADIHEINAKIRASNYGVIYKVTFDALASDQPIVGKLKFNPLAIGTFEEYNINAGSYPAIHVAAYDDYGHRFETTLSRKGRISDSVVEEAFSIDAAGMAKNRPEGKPVSFYFVIGGVSNMPLEISFEADGEYGRALRCNGTVWALGADGPDGRPEGSIPAKERVKALQSSGAE